jgi:hypothetical protein
MIFLLHWVKPDMKIKVDEEDTEDTKIYLYAGGDESDTMIEHVKTSRIAPLQVSL